MRRIHSAILLTLLLALGCTEESGSKSGSGTATSGTGAAASTEEGLQASEKVIGYTTMSLTNPFFKVIADNMADEAVQHGYVVETVSGDDDVIKQANQVEDFINRKVSAIVITPCDPVSIGAAIRKANEAGIPVFTNDTSYNGDEGTVECHVATDNLQGGRLAGEAMVKLLGETGGKVLIVDKPDAASCIKRVSGFMEIIDAHNTKADARKIDVVDKFDGQGDREVGYRVTKDAIVKHEDLKALFAINDPSALGAYTALDEAGKADQVTIIGFDGERAGKEAIREGKILCDPIQFPDRIARVTVQNIVKYFNAEEVPKEILIESSLYYKADAEKDASLK